MKEKLYKLAKEHWLPLTIILGLAVGFILLFSHSTSPLSWYYDGTDASIPVTISRGWYYKIIPYKDLFTSNGPWMYWLGSIGIGFVHGNKSGIIIPQIINMFFFLLSVYCLTQLTTKNKVYACMVQFVTIVFLKINYPDGMYTEEFLLPWIGWSYYFVFSYFKNHKWNPFKSLFFGISLGVTVMCNMNGIIAFIPILFVYFYFIYQKQWKLLFKNLILLCIGMITIIVPFILYFYHQGCLNEFIYDVFQYQEDSFYTGTKTTYYYKILFFYRFPIFASFFASIFYCFKKRYIYGLIMIVLCIEECLFFFQMDFSTYLSMFTVINIVFLCNSIFLLLPLKNHPKTTMILCITISFISLYQMYLKDFPQAISIVESYGIYHNEGWEGLVDNIPSEDYDKIVIYGGKNITNAYLLTNAMPCYKYFCLQDKVANNDENIKEKIIDTFSTNQAKWILTDSNTETIQDILDSDYVLYDQTSIYSLYQRKS